MDVTFDAGQFTKTELKTKFDECGYVIIKNVLTDTELKKLKQASQSALEKTCDSLENNPYFDRNIEMLLLPLVLQYESEFLSILEHPIVVDLLPVLFSSLATLRLQILGTSSRNYRKTVPPENVYLFHRNFRHFSGQPLLAIDFIFMLEYDEGIPFIEIVPDTHRHFEPYDRESFSKRSIPYVIPSNSLLILNSILWHRDVSCNSLLMPNRLYVHNQFVRPFIKPYFDYARVLGEEKIRSLSPWLQQMLGWNSRVPTSLEEFYVAPEERLYRADRWE